MSQNSRITEAYYTDFNVYKSAMNMSTRCDCCACTSTLQHHHQQQQELAKTLSCEQHAMMCISLFVPRNSTPLRGRDSASRRTLSSTAKHTLRLPARTCRSEKTTHWRTVLCGSAASCSTSIARRGSAGSTVAALEASCACAH
jgi:hypothetical protein